ncbi:hypothetical protein H2248_011391 [Termitomyces sp. 'cryptogamus']|nr:hypothetical protein H2248_011391 [Termitomyces sp. 'cryptogamus']
MSSTLYNGPVSLPADFAFSRYVGLRAGDKQDEQNRRMSSSPKNSTNIHQITPLISKPPSENTPLLKPLIRRINKFLNDDDWIVYTFWEELRILTRYALPVFGTHALEFSLVMVPVISIGHLSTTALAAITLGSMTANVTAFSILQGFASALDTILPSTWTSSQPQLVGLWTQRMLVVMIFLLFPMYFIWFNAEPLLLTLRQDPEVAQLAAVYLRWASIGLPAYAFNCVNQRYFQSQGRFAISTRINLIVAPINVILNYFLVWGPPSIRLGFIGAPIATAISFNLVALMSIACGVFYVPKTAWYPLSRRMFTSLGVLLHLGLAGVGQTASEWWAWELVAIAASLLGPVALATQSVLLSSASMTFQVPFALSVATSVRIGNLLGEGNAKRASIASNTSIIMALILSVATSMIFIIFKDNWAYLFNSDPDVVSLVASILPLVALFQVFDGNAAVTDGILRARGKQVTGALLNLTSYYVIGIPFGIWLAFSWDMGVHGLWIGLTVSLVYCSFFGTLLCVHTDWNREVRKVIKRLKEEQDRAERLYSGHGHERDEESRHNNSPRSHSSTFL